MNTPNLKPKLATVSFAFKNEPTRKLTMGEVDAALRIAVGAPECESGQEPYLKWNSRLVEQFVQGESFKDLHGTIQKARDMDIFEPDLVDELDKVVSWFEHNVVISITTQELSLDQLLEHLVSEMERAIGRSGQ